MRRLAITMIFAAACQHDEACSEDDRAGRFAMVFIERTGTCGPMEATIFYADDASTLPTDCYLDAEDRWSVDMCSQSRTYWCINEASLNDYKFESSIHEIDPDTFRGTIEMTANTCDEDANCTTCSSTYDVEMTRT